MITYNSSMTGKEKKAHAEKLMANGDQRSYNEIKADIELEIWRERFSSIKKIEPKQKKSL